LASQVEGLGGGVICLHKRPGIEPGVFVRMRAALRRLRPDVVHTHQIGSLFYGGPAARGTGVPLVVHTEHGREPYHGRLRTRLLGRLAGRFAARFYCLSADMARAVLAHRIVPRHKVQVIGNGIETRRFRDGGDRTVVRQDLGIPADAVVFGTVGRLTEVKRPDLLLRAFAQVRMKVPASHLLIVGDGPLRSELGGLATTLGLDGGVHFAGYQAQPERLYRAMDVFALTSRSEGIPQAVLEASAAGLPVIASRVGGVPEVVEDGQTGLLFEFGDVPALAAGLHALATNAALARRLSEAGRRRVEDRFDVGRMAEAYHHQFLGLLGRHGETAGRPSGETFRC
jgi:glycosyltransferase involved in cell wall biosynthesis